jgi:hypothetical protein
VADVAGYGGANTGLTFGGSTAVVASNSSNVTINGNEVARTRCSSRYDGAAIDLDQDTNSSEVAYNLTYNNVGPSIQVGSFGGFTTANVRVHHNVSYNDARGNNLGGTSEQGVVRVWGHADTIQIFNNTVWFDANFVGVPSGINFEFGANTKIAVLNNIFSLASGANMFHGNQIVNATHIPTAGSSGLLALGNLYDGQGSLVVSNDNGTSYTAISTLSAWRSASYEVFSATNYGVQAAAKIRNVSVFSPAANGFIGAGISISSVGNFDQAPSAPQTASGINPSLVSVTLGSYDYHGNSSMDGSAVDIGAVSWLPIPTSGLHGTSVLRGAAKAR